MATILLLTGPQAGKRFEIHDELTLGRSPSCTIPLEDAKVSRRHVRVFVENDDVKVVDLGSRNGTQVNGEKIDAEVVLLPGDRLQVGDSTAVFEPSAPASLIEHAFELEPQSAVVEELLPSVGPVAGLFNASVALLSAANEGMALRRAAEEVAHAFDAEIAASLLGGTEGLLTAEVVGAKRVEVPRLLVFGAMERKEVGRVGGALCAPIIASGGAPFGIVYAQRPEPFSEADQRLMAAVGRLVGEVITALRSRKVERYTERVLVGNARPFRKAIEHARRVALSSDCVSIVGEPGAGRKALATYLHSRSARALGPFLTIDCRQPESQLEEQFFGRSSRPGVPPMTSVLLKADSGTLLLSNIDFLPVSLGERLGGLFERKAAPARQGGEEPVNVRVVSTSRQSLVALAQRSQLAAALARVFGKNEIEMPRLQERQGDILPLFTHFVEKQQRAAVGEPLTRLSPEAQRLLLNYSFPYNIDELRRLAVHLSTLYPGAEVGALELPPEIQRGEQAAKASLPDLVAQLEREVIAEALRSARGKKIEAAAILGISRPTLDKKISDYQLTVDKRRD
jgi:DNA-binding NtrC family response regulator/pSer/pThr/pTyr-binding forkhead associated (FHA) protein